MQYFFKNMKERNIYFSMMFIHSIFNPRYKKVTFVFSGMCMMLLGISLIYTIDTTSTIVKFLIS